MADSRLNRNEQKAVAGAIASASACPINPNEAKEQQPKVHPFILAVENFNNEIMGIISDTTSIPAANENDQKSYKDQHEKISVAFNFLSILLSCKSPTDALEKNKKTNVSPKDLLVIFYERDKEITFNNNKIPVIYGRKSFESAKLYLKFLSAKVTFIEETIKCIEKTNSAIKASIKLVFWFKSIDLNKLKIENESEYKLLETSIKTYEEAHPSPVVTAKNSTRVAPTQTDSKSLESSARPVTVPVATPTAIQKVSEASSKDLKHVIPTSSNSAVQPPVSTRLKKEESAKSLHSMKEKTAPQPKPTGPSRANLPNYYKLLDLIESELTQYTQKKSLLLTYSAKDEYQRVQAIIADIERLMKSDLRDSEFPTQTQTKTILIHTADQRYIEHTLDSLYLHHYKYLVESNSSSTLRFHLEKILRAYNYKITTQENNNILRVMSERVSTIPKAIGRGIKSLGRTIGLVGGIMDDPEPLFNPSKKPKKLKDALLNSVIRQENIFTVIANGCASLFGKAVGTLGRCIEKFGNLFHRAGKNLAAESGRYTVRATKPAPVLTQAKMLLQTFPTQPITEDTVKNQPQIESVRTSSLTASLSSKAIGISHPSLHCSKVPEHRPTSLRQ